MARQDEWRYGRPEPYGTASYDPRYEPRSESAPLEPRRRAPKGYFRSDERIREDIYERLIQSEDIDSEDVTVRVEQGKVALEGTVPERRMKHQIEDLAESCLGVTEVDNGLRVHEKRGFFGRLLGGKTVRDVMTRDVTLTSPDASLQEAARAMERIEAGILPVGENDRLIGMITDRDIAVRGVAAGRDPKATRVREVMTQEVLYCYEDEDIGQVADNMARQQVRRLPVLNRAKRLVGIVALGDLARTHESSTIGETLESISQRGGRHTQH